MALDKVVDSAVLDADLLAVADAIRAKGGTGAALAFPAGFVEAVQAISAGGDTSAEDSLVTRTATEYVNARVTTVGGSAFSRCENLVRVDLPNVISTTGKGYSFSACGSLVDVNLPLLQYGTSYWLERCYSLEYINLPSIKRVGYGAFRECSALKRVDLGSSLEQITGTLFQDCSALNEVVLRRTDGIVPLYNTDCFKRTPFGSGGTGGTVYVPEALIPSYQTETNWSTLYAEGTCNFVAIEGSEYE